jgi:putative phosphoesterase
VTGITRVGLVSDTHGVLPPRVFVALAGVTRILHAGDIGSSAVLDDLARIAPVTAVRGNTDVDYELALRLPSFSVTDVDGVRFALTHIKGRAIGLEDARRRGCDVYVYGHTHISAVTDDDGLWVVNPGSPSRARNGSGHSVAVVEVSAGEVLSVEVVPLD